MGTGGGNETDVSGVTPGRCGHKTRAGVSGTAGPSFSAGDAGSTPCGPAPAPAQTTRIGNRNLPLVQVLLRPPLITW